jgi:hypothetical protein
MVSMFGKKPRHRGPTAEDRCAKVGLNVKAQVPKRALRIKARARNCSDMLKPLHKSQQACPIVCEQNLGPLVEERFGIWIKEQRIQKYVSRERRCVVRLFCRLESDIPGTALPRLPPEKNLSKHAERAMPERVPREGGPLRRIVCNLLQPLKPRPVSSKIMLKLYATTGFVPPQRTNDREIIKNSRVFAWQLT